jgi:hypothetical protein
VAGLTSAGVDGVLTDVVTADEEWWNHSLGFLVHKPKLDEVEPGNL